MLFYSFKWLNCAIIQLDHVHPYYYFLHEYYKLRYHRIIEIQLHYIHSFTNFSLLFSRDTDCLTASHDWARYISSSRVHSFSNAYKEFYNEDPVVFNTILKRFLEYLSKSNDSWFHNSSVTLLILLTSLCPSDLLRFFFVTNHKTLKTRRRGNPCDMKWSNGCKGPFGATIIGLPAPAVRPRSILAYKMNYNRFLLMHPLPYLRHWAGSWAPTVPESNYLSIICQLKLLIGGPSSVLNSWLCIFSDYL